MASIRGDDVPGAGGQVQGYGVLGTGTPSTIQEQGGEATPANSVGVWGVAGNPADIAAEIDVVVSNFDQRVTAAVAGVLPKFTPGDPATLDAIAFGFLAGTVPNSGDHAGVYGESGEQGVKGLSTGDSGTGVFGENSTGHGVGVEGRSFGRGLGTVGRSTDGIGVVGSSTSGTGVSGVGGSIGVRGVGSDVGVKGDVDASGFTPPVQAGVWGDSNGGIGVVGSSKLGAGVFGYCDGARTQQQYPPLSFVAIHGQCKSDRFGDFYFGDRSHVAIFGDGGNKGVGLYGKGGVPGTSGAGGGLAGYFDGDVLITGDLSKGGGGFKIDHPLDPANKYLNHSFVESPDRKNICDGIVSLGAEGRATVELPKWFEALNRDFRYQLTCLGGYAPVYVAEQILNCRFTIAGGKPGLEVSWQVTGIRMDRWAQAHPMEVEEEKMRTVELRAAAGT